MIYYYKFRNEHNGYMISNHPFISDKLLDQKEVNKILLTSKHPLERIGTSVEEFIDCMNENGYNLRALNEDEGCGGIEKIIYGICGNY